MKKRRKKAVDSSGVVPVDTALQQPELVAPELHEGSRKFGDEDESNEDIAIREEGLGRHGFRSLIG
jgi:hypothetical protein